MNDIMQGAITTEQPFKIYPDGVYFRNEQGYGITLTKRGRDDGTIQAICDALNVAYQRGFCDGTVAVMNNPK